MGNKMETTWNELEHADTSIVGTTRRDSFGRGQSWTSRRCDLERAQSSDNDYCARRSLKSALLVAAAGIMLSGCAFSRDIAKVKHFDGSGETTYRYIAAGGIFRPGVIVIVSQTIGSNAPAVLVQASGPPAAPSLLGGAGEIASAFVFGKALGDRENNNTTIIQGDPPAPMIVPPTLPTVDDFPHPRPPRNRAKSPHNNGF